MRSPLRIIILSCGLLALMSLRLMARPGGPVDALVDDKDVVAAAKFAVQAEQKALKAEGKNEELTLVKIVSARKQVVAGMNYFLTLKVKLGDKPAAAEATVYERAWENKIELTNWKFTEVP